MDIASILSNVRTADFVLNLAAQSSAFLLGGWFISLLMKRASAPWRSGILLALILILAFWPLKIALMPLPQAGLFRIDVGIPIRGSAEISRRNGRDTAEQAAVTAPAPLPQNASLGASRRPLESPFSSWHSVPPVILWTNALGGLWMLGTLVFIARIFYGLALLSRFRNGLREIDNPRLIAILEKVQAAARASKRFTVYASPTVKTPVAYGLIRPRIVLPSHLVASIRPEEFRSLLVHEMGHLRHCDQAAGLLQRFIAAFYWWNPLVYAINARFSVIREEVCDTYGILENGARPYAECLLGLAQKVDLVNHLPSAVGISTPRFPLEKRIESIISKKRNLNTRLAKPAILGLVGLAVAATLLVGGHGLALRSGETMSTAAVPLTVVPLPMVRRPMALSVGNGRIYILDVGEPGAVDPSGRPSDIKILSVSDYLYLNSFGTNGSGPEEFLTGPGIPRIQGDSIWCEDIRKIVVFSPDGEFQRAMQFPNGFRLAGFPLLPVGDNYVTLNSNFNRRLADGSYEWIGRVYDKELQFLRSFGSGIPSSVLYPPPPPPPPRPGQKGPDENEGPLKKSAYQAIPDCLEIAVAENKVFIADTRKGFSISVFDDSGLPLYEIHKDYTRLKVPADFKNSYMRLINDRSAWLLNVANFEFRKEFPAFMSFKVADGRIYVATYARQGGMNELIVMNFKGDILKRSFSFPLSLDFDPNYHNFNVSKIRYDISQEKIFFLSANERTGAYELHIQSFE